ncbi:hypothetical protein WOLCODRAFT_136346 [Wolfiporia cocos MD-104 SS10]|uniref:Mitochondrial adapter protein MCP1 transmembrane domain-containing protein n=1 Tax=Wolfiporia cocos (strain MD-104) TaxID=742152 RepID=A0A2H3JPL1_WOLCO|nr:hypothetical protein WOLCODRAFT_136346 [Wolfiporia cocos MD-104 SS10]
MTDVPKDERPPRTKGWRRIAVAVLTTLSHGTAPLITTFVLIHLAAPVLAIVGGSSLASQTMLLGREYYQTALGEPFLLFAPLLLHPLTSTLRRVLAPHLARPLPNSFTLAGYAASFSIVGHVLANRVFPMDPAPPVLAVGPAELDFEFVKLAVQTWPVRTVVAYTGLVAAVVWHATQGMAIMWNRYLRAALGGVSVGARKTALVTAGVLLTVYTSLYVLANEPPMVLASTAARFHAALIKSPMFA